MKITYKPPPFVYPGKAMAQRWIGGETEQVKQELTEMILPARLLIMGSVLAELHNVSDHHCQRFVSLVLNNELSQYPAPTDGRCRLGRCDG